MNEDQQIEPNPSDFWMDTFSEEIENEFGSTPVAVSEFK